MSKRVFHSFISIKTWFILVVHFYRLEWEEQEEIATAYNLELYRREMKMHLNKTKRFCQRKKYKISTKKRFFLYYNRVKSTTWKLKENGSNSIISWNSWQYFNTTIVTASILGLIASLHFNLNLYMHWFLNRRQIV